MNTSETTNLGALIQRVEGLSEAANDMLAAVREREADLGGGGNSEAYSALNARVTELSETVDAIRETASGGGGLDEAAISQAVAALEKSYETHAATLTGKIRERLTQNLTLYVRPDGNDNNDGSADSPTSALKTLGGVWGLLKAIDFGGFGATVLLAPGDYAGGGFDGHTINGPVAIRGIDPSAKPNITSMLQLVRWKGFALENLRFLGTFRATNDSKGYVNKSDFIHSGGTANKHVICALGFADLDVVNITFEGDASSAMLAQHHSRIGLGNDAVMALINNPTYTWGVATADQMSSFYCGSTSFTGANKGQRFSVGGLSFIDSNGRGPNFFPGAIAGTVNTAEGGIYA